MGQPLGIVSVQTVLSHLKDFSSSFATAREDHGYNSGVYLFYEHCCKRIILIILNLLREAEHFESSLRFWELLTPFLAWFFFKLQLPTTYFTTVFVSNISPGLFYYSQTFPTFEQSFFLFRFFSYFMGHHHFFFFSPVFLVVSALTFLLLLDGLLWNFPSLPVLDFSLASFLLIIRCWLSFLFHLVSTIFYSLIGFDFRW